MSHTEMLALADKLVTIFDRIGGSCDWRLSSEERQDIAKAAVALHAAAPPPAGADAWQTAKVSIDVSTCDADAGRRVFGRVVDWQPEDFDGEKPLGLRLLCEYESDNFGLCAGPPPAGADAVRELPETLPDICYGWLSSLRGHHTGPEHTKNGKARWAFLRADYSAALLPTPQPQEKPTGDQT